MGTFEPFQIYLEVFFQGDISGPKAIHTNLVPCLQMDMVCSCHLFGFLEVRAVLFSSVLFLPVAFLKGNCL